MNKIIYHVMDDSCNDKVCSKSLYNYYRSEFGRTIEGYSVYNPQGVLIAWATTSQGWNI